MLMSLFRIREATLDQLSKNTQNLSKDITDQEREKYTSERNFLNEVISKIESDIGNIYIKTR